MKHHHLGTRVIGVGYIHPRGTGTEREGAAREVYSKLSSHLSGRRPREYRDANVGAAERDEPEPLRCGRTLGLGLRAVHR